MAEGYSIVKRQGDEIDSLRARIDAALAVVMGTRAVGNPHLESVLTKMVEALKGGEGTIEYGFGPRPPHDPEWKP